MTPSNRTFKVKVNVIIFFLSLIRTFKGKVRVSISFLKQSLIVVDSGVITSPYHNVDQYPPNSDCLWVIDIDPGQIVTLRFTAFDLESTEDCSADSVTIYSGSSIDPDSEMIS